MDRSPSMEVFSTFPRFLLKSQIGEALLAQLQGLGNDVLADLSCTTDASAKLASQLTFQRELPSNHPAVARLCTSVILPGCEYWICHVIDREAPQGRGP